jgi:undecaprenyl diphosphate synthase
LNDVDEKIIQQKLLTGTSTDPDLIIRTSGEYRLSNFLLWQAAYSEMFFLDKQWPELNKFDLLQVIRQYANDRKRRFGK